jgi:hypothetical protein
LIENNRFSNESKRRDRMAKRANSNGRRENPRRPLLFWRSLLSDIQGLNIELWDTRALNRSHP